MDIVRFCLLVVLLCGTEAHVSHRGPCPKVDFPMEGFKPEKFVGDWYVQRSFDPSSSCLVFNYTRCGEFCLRVTESKQLSVISRIGVTNVYRTDGFLRLNYIRASEMRASFRTNPRPAMYTVLETDYDKMAVVFTCQNVGLSSMPLYHRRDVYLLSRSKNNTFTPDHITQVSDTLIRNEIEDEFSEVDQDDCLAPSDADLDLNASRFGQRVTQVAQAVTTGIGSIFGSISDLFTSGSSEPAAVGVAPL